MDLVSELVQRQGAEPDEQFAARLGVTRMTWRFIKAGKNQPGRKTLAGIVRAYPDLKRSVVPFLLTAIDSTDTKADSEHAPEATS